MRQETASPKWGNTTKLVVALTLIAVMAALLVRLRVYLGPLILAFVLAYMFHPIVLHLHKWSKIPWRLTVVLVFLVLVLILLGLLTWGGFTLVDQAQSLVNFLENAVENVLDFINNLDTFSFQIGPFVYDFSVLELGISDLTNQFLSMIEPLFTRVGSVIGTITSSAVSILGFVVFVLLIAYFILSESEGVEEAFDFNIPGYQYDARRLRKELSRIWNAFLRGQFILFILTVVVYTIFLGGMGVRFFIGLAFLAGLARFVPYVGPAITWTVYFLVSFFQGTTVLNLLPIAYSLIIVGIALVIDNVIDTFVTPKMMGNALRVHPAAILVAALVGASILGVVGVLLASPVLATFKLGLDYALSKLFDLDPWERLDKMVSTSTPSFNFQKWVALWNRIREKIAKSKFNKNKNKSKKKEVSDDRTI